MFKKNPSKPQNRIDSLIGVGTRVEGNVNFKGGLRIDGEVLGNVTASPEQPSTLVVSEQARITGEIRVSHVVVNGTVVGPILSSEFLELQSNARVTGDVEYNTLEVHLGAIVDGKLLHASDANGKAVELKLASSQ
jgi:cytoskeletal protein CcmA (bactofilin family)